MSFDIKKDKLTVGFTMDPNMRGKLVWSLLLCIVGAVATQNNCTTLGQVNELDKACINSTIGLGVFLSANLTHRLALLCSSRSAYEICMVEKTAGCSEMSDIMEEVESLLYGCLITDQWAEKYLVPYVLYASCRGNDSNIPKCFEDMNRNAQRFPFSDDLFKNGLDKLHMAKQIYFSCILEWYQMSGSCAYDWRQSYMNLVVQTMQSRRYFGLHLDSQDISDFENLQAEIDAQQATAKARDLFHAGFPFFE